MRSHFHGRLRPAYANRQLILGLRRAWESVTPGSSLLVLAPPVEARGLLCSILPTLRRSVSREIFLVPGHFSREHHIWTNVYASTQF